MNELRRMTGREHDDWMSGRYAARRKTSPFIAMVAGKFVYAQSVTEKRKLVESLSPDAVVIWAWDGAWATDVFELTVAEAMRLLSEDD